MSSPLTGTAAPEGADSIRFILSDVKVNGATIFTPEQLRTLYASYIGKEITLAAAYGLAEAITKQYRDAGYFLSLAYIPNQRIGDGIVIIQVVEGYIGKVEVDETVREHSVVQSYIDQLLSLRPLRADAVESLLLRLGDVPGYSFGAILSSLPDAQDGAVKLTLATARKSGQGTVSFDNQSSRFLGPHQLSASYARSLIPLQETTVSALTGLPTEKLKYGTLNHAVLIAPGTTLELTGGITKSRPGFTLEPLDIDSRSTYLSAALAYQLIRQRDENLALKIALDGRNTSSDVLGTPLTRESSRAVRLSAVYDGTDRWYGSNLASLTVSQGIDAVGSSEPGDINLSRAEAEPDFTKVELSITRLQGFSGEWSIVGAAAGQWASQPLYSSEEFGYGGQSFGRAYDVSELTGDMGIEASLELRYGGWGSLQPVSLQPYAFCDFGTVWNLDAGQQVRESGASAGLGVRAATLYGITGGIGVAWPIIREASTPIYGSSSSGPRLSLDLMKRF